ncbi:c-type cytochrome [Planctomicrobium sp. SH668]|uniref:c-type cytochrome n=1 Tax=Planctomicrobium sp. SH668 TaxID=3448126 RepID=UPI003F5C95EF
MKLFPLRTSLLIMAFGSLVCGWSFLAVGQEDKDSGDAVRSDPEGELARMIQLGEEIVRKTTSHELSRAYSGNALNCTSCHLDEGRHPTAAPFIGVATAYPAWSPREKKVITLEERSRNCFMRSMNGTAPPLGSDVLTAITAYITSLSEGEPIRMNPVAPLGPNAVPALSIDPRKADPKRGGLLYAGQCGHCHGDQGEGTEDGPPVWGDRSFNDGAGLAKVEKLAAWIRVAMPLDDTHLTEQEALDVAAFINSHSRPRFTLPKE